VSPSVELTDCFQSNNSLLPSFLTTQASDHELHHRHSRALAGKNCGAGSTQTIPAASSGLSFPGYTNVTMITRILAGITSGAIPLKTASGFNVTSLVCGSSVALSYQPRQVVTLSAGDAAEA
jgi:hypothetical protein